MWKKIIGGILFGILIGFFIGWYVYGKPGNVISSGVTSSGNRYQVLDK